MTWSAPVVLMATMLGLYLAVSYLRARYPLKTNALVDQVDALLPQTQCAQCGYPGCRPYAHALVEDTAATNLCPPGGSVVHQQLEKLLNPYQPTTPPAPEVPSVAIIDEAQCIGCTLCLPPCPVDAIVGAQGLMHSVTSDCTGCELCIPACPVDCISLQPLNDPPSQEHTNTAPLQSSGADCIQCQLCEPVCPVDLPAAALLYAARRDVDQAVGLGLSRCIECGLCSRACPSEIPMVQVFAQAKEIHRADLADTLAKENLKARFAAHELRLAQASASRDRSKRLKQRRSWQ